jgi:hypothetical protein
MIIFPKRVAQIQRRVSSVRFRAQNGDLEQPAKLGPLPASVEPTNESLRKFAASHTAPCQALREGIDLIVVAAGKGQ